VLDFRRRDRKATNFLGKTSAQRRVLALVAISGLVLILTLRAGDPAAWKWIDWEQPQEVVDNQANKERDSADPTKKPVGGADVPAIEVELPTPLNKGELLPQIRRDYMNTVRDDTVFLPDEADAWFHLFDVLRKADPDDIKRTSLGKVGYVQLDQQASDYRGRVVELSGTVRAAKRLEPVVNAFNVESYYQLWLQPERNAPALVVVYARQLPSGFPLGDQLDVQVSLTGIFFKRWTYASQGGVTTAPLVAADTVEWQAPAAKPARAQTAEAPVGTSVARAFIIAGLLAFAVVVLLAWRLKAIGKRSEFEADRRFLASLPTGDRATPAE